jgi:membrane protein YqaA with SNARE-associated domain
MENIIAQIEHFLLNNAWGVIIAGAIASLLGGVLRFAIIKIVKYLKKKFRIRETERKKRNYILSFYRGAVTSYSKYSSYRQILLVGDYIIDVLFVGLKIIAYLLIACMLIIISKSFWVDMAIIAICSFLVSPQYIILKRTVRAFKMTYDYVFGKDFTRKCVDGAYDSFIKRQEEKDQNTENVD